MVFTMWQDILPFVLCYLRLNGRQYFEGCWNPLSKMLFLLYYPIWFFRRWFFQYLPSIWMSSLFLKGWNTRRAIFAYDSRFSLSSLETALLFKFRSSMLHRLPFCMFKTGITSNFRLRRWENSWPGCDAANTSFACSFWTCGNSSSLSQPLFLLFVSKPLLLLDANLLVWLFYFISLKVCIAFDISRNRHDCKSHFCRRDRVGWCSRLLKNPAKGLFYPMVLCFFEFVHPQAALRVLRQADSQVDWQTHASIQNESRQASWSSGPSAS